MKDLSCEKVLMAMMATADGETAELSLEEIREHSSACQDCRDEAVRMQPIIELLQQATRAEQTVDLWPAVSSRLERQAPRLSWKPYAFVAVLLFAYKLIEMLPDEELGWAIKLVPLIIFGALLVFLKENPFKINSELVLEK
jgi:predicted anti-sigma-YlaC factor YlaD